jgi:predicted kinase
MAISIPKLSLVVLIDPSGSGKSTFARKHFLPTEILSSDACRAIVSDNENNQAVTNEAFALLHYVAAQRLTLGRLTVIDATNVQPEARAPLVTLARKFHCLPVAVVLNLPDAVCHERNRLRPDRSFGAHVIRNQRSQLRRSLKGLRREGFRHVFVLETPEEVESAVIERVPLWNDRTHEHGPFDIIGDVHGCADELDQLLERLGYSKNAIAANEPGWSNIGYVHPEGRKAIFVGDLVDRGPRVRDTLSIARNMVKVGSALCVPGNHDMKLLKKLNGKDVQITHGLAQSLAEIDALPEDVRTPFMKSLAEFLDGLVSHYVLDDGKLVVAHAGMKAEMQGRGSGKVRHFALYGETTGETDEFGLPIRYNWATEYRGELMPWSAKAQELLKTQYAAVGAAGQAALPKVVASLAQATERLGGDERNKVEQVMADCRRREEHVGQFIAAYRQYCWPVNSLTDLKLAPFHLLASEARVHTDKNHTWHMDTLASVCRTDPELLLATNYKLVDVTDSVSEADGVAWWTELTGRGGEGMVVKPLDFIVRGKRGLAQPAVKCRGREYLRIIYGPDYTADENLSRPRRQRLPTSRVGPARGTIVSR